MYPPPGSNPHRKVYKLRRIHHSKEANPEAITVNPYVPIQPVRTDLYIPYRYASQRYQLHRYSHQGEPSSPTPSPNTTEPFYTAGLNGHIDKGPQTVEQLISQGYFSAAPSPSETALLEDKMHSAWLLLDDTIYQIRQRIDMYSQNMYELKLAQCAAQNDVFAFEARYGWPAPTEQQYVRGKRLQRLYSEQRSERLALWQDVSRLRQTVPESVQHYLSTFSKIEILNDSAGDAL